MIYCKELNKSFATKEELIKELKANKELIVKEKTSQIYKSFEKGLSIIANQEAIHKALETSKAFKMDNECYYFVVNSANILDSHSDVHVSGNWDKTVKEQQGKVYLVFDHTLKRSEVIAMKEDIELITAEIPFSLLGKSYEGSSYCLIYKVRKEKIVNAEAKKWLEDGYSLEASVRMQYVKIDLAVNSSTEGDEKEKETFDKYHPIIANKAEYDEIYYFWVIREAKNVHESSLVMFGSNGATGLIENENKQEAEPITSEIKAEPEQSTQKATEMLKELLKTI